MKLLVKIFIVLSIFIPSLVYANEIVIGLSLDTLAEERWKKDRDIFTQEVEKLGAKVVVEVANNDDTHQIMDIKSLIANKVDCLVIVPHDCDAMAKAVELADEADIPVISYDRLINNAEVEFYLTFDNIKIGEIQAQFLVDALGGKGRIVRLYGAPTDSNSNIYKEGQDNILQPYIDRGDIIVIHEDWVQDWTSANAKKIMNAALIKSKNIDGVLATNDGTAGGAIQALKEAGLAGKILVTGLDADEVACQRIINGTQAMTVYTPIVDLAKKAAELAVSFAKGEVIYADTMVDNGYTDVPSIFVNVIPVTKNNMRETVIADGFHSEEDIYK